MVLDISIQANEKPLDINHRSQSLAYTVYAENHRILTVVTSCDQTLSQWLDDVVKATKNKLQTLLVGVSVERQTLQYAKGGVRDEPYDLLNLCVGSHCVIYYLPDLNGSHLTPRSLRSFFDNPRVVAVGMDMEAVAQKLERDHEIKIKNPKDLRTLAVEGLKRSGDNLDLRRYDLDKLAKTVLGKHMDVVRPEEKVEWYDSTDYWWWYRELSLEKVQFATIDAYLCFLVGSELLDMINGGGTGASFSSKKEKKKKKKK